MKKRILSISLLVILAGLAILVIKKWDTWFANLPEPAYYPPATSDRIILSMGENAQTERYLSWRYDTVPTPGHVELWNLASNDTLKVIAQDTVVNSRAGKSCFYHASLKDLQPLDYKYRVVNDTVFSPWYDFSIPGDTVDLSFIFLGDIQDTIRGTTQQIFRDIHQRFPQAGFWAFVGDIIERPMDIYWNHWFDSMDSITQTTPILAATGNHEYLKGVKKILDSRWTSTFKNPANGPKGFEGRTYLVSFADLDFITLDTDGLQTPADYIRVRKWLARTLEQSDKKWKIVMMHHPIYSVRSGRDNPFMRWTFKPVFEKYNVDLVLEGHDHGYSRIATKRKGNKQTTPLYIDSNCSPKLYAIGFDGVHDRLGSNLNLYQYITLKGDSLFLKVYTTAHEIYDDLLVTKDMKGTTVHDYATGVPEKLQLPDAYKNWKKKKRNKYEEGKKQRQQEHPFLK